MNRAFLKKTITGKWRSGSVAQTGRHVEYKRDDFTKTDIVKERAS